MKEGRPNGLPSFFFFKMFISEAFDKTAEVYFLFVKYSMILVEYNPIYYFLWVVDLELLCG